MGKQRKKRLNKIIPIGVYPFDLMISFNESDKDVIKSLKKFNINAKKTSEKTVFDMDKIKNKQGRMVMFIGKQTIIRLNFMPKTSDPFEMALLQHEIFHTVGFLMQEINTPLNDDTHEVYAYLTQYLTEQIYKEL
jgi:hypothetical protein